MFQQLLKKRRKQRSKALLEIVDKKPERYHPGFLFFGMQDSYESHLVSSSFTWGKRAERVASSSLEKFWRTKS